MKFDSQSQYHHSYPAHEHDTNVILHDNNPFILAKDDHFMIDTLNLRKEALKEGRHGFTSPIERKSSRVAEEWEQYLDMEYSTNINNTGDETVLKENFYTDKAVTKVEVLERRVCIEDDHHNVRDINMDKGVQSSDKSLVQEEVKDIEEACPAQSSTSNLNLDNGYNDSTGKIAGSSGAYDLKYTVFESSISILDQDQVDPPSVLHKDLVGKATENPANETSSFHNDSDGKQSIDSKGDLDSTESILGNIPAEVTESVAVPVPDVHNYCHEKGSLVSSIDCGGKLDASKSAVHNISSDVVEDQVLQSSVVPVPDVHNHHDEKCSPVSSIDCRNKLDAYKSAVHNISCDAIEDQVLPSQEITTASLQVDLPSQALQNDQNHSLDVPTLQDLLRDSNSASRALSFPSEVSALSNESKEIPASGVITFNFDTEPVSTSGRHENEETANSQPAVAAQNGFHTEEGILDAPSSSSRYSFLHLMEGESSLSGPSILSGPIANSGHIPFSGNISLRSDSSTTSARSFAFPILQSEWNSSPVKMAKAERRKHRGWKMGLLCCRF
ncbi:uncharacterized protein A4U43_C05F22100 [Asparagus officinalis]|uniref:18S pre-ribosomal assembly protein gar2-related n=1 Tax=Asparagus officinalis TaxID=4686 RepID=A0A5P1ETS3_ASPOF|nr:uncharacterized protein LOC109840218 isoform X2 [Asparagus officinalis]ONK69366.1 uncharacterized protein A4U43_C05F22100 [Asparagus officinalis]